jgi:hypothetical protein
MQKVRLIFVLLLIVLGAYAREPDDALNSFGRNMSTLTRKFGKQSDIARLLQQISNHWEVIEFITKTQAGIPEQYLESVRDDARLLERLAKQEPSSESEQRSFYEELKELESELSVKARATRGSGDAVTLVEVLVHAKRGDQDVGDYVVWYVQRGWANDASRKKRFERLAGRSGPASAKIPPGNYFIWLEGPSSTARQPLSFGLNGEDKSEVDVVVP